MQTLRTPGVALRLSEDVTPGQTTIIKEVQILKTGRFFDPRYKWFEITEKILGEMMSNFESGVRGLKPALDYSHDSEGVAAGWIKELFLKPGEKAGSKELWGKVELTPRCQKVLADKEFGYISADFDDNYLDNETGKKHGAVLKGAALTNRPVIKGMEAVIQLSEQEPEKKSETETQPEGDPVDQKEMETKLADANKKLGDVDAVLKAAGVADLEALMKWIGEQKSKTEAAPAMEKELTDAKKELTDTKKELSEANKRLSGFESTAKNAEKETEFTKLLSEGKAVAAQKEAFIAGDMKKFAELAQPLKTEEEGHSASSKELGEADDEILKAAKKLSEEKKISVTEAIPMVLSENKELREKRQKNLG